jgi:transposase-like protein
MPDVGGRKKDEARDTLERAVIDFHIADADLAEAVTNALRAGISVAEIARETGLPYSRVLNWRRYSSTLLTVYPWMGVLDQAQEALRVIAALLNASDRGHPGAEAFLEAHGGYFKAVPAGETGYPGRWVAPRADE